MTHKLQLTWNGIGSRPFVFMLVLVHLVFLVYTITGSHDHFEIPDALEYYTLAENVFYDFQFYSSDLGAASLDPEAFTKRPPLYSIFILLSSLLLNSKVTIFLAQAVLSILGFYLIKTIFDEHFGAPRRLIVIVFILSSLSQFIYTNMVMSEVFLQFLIVLTVYCSYRLLKYGRIKFLLLYQFCVVLLFLTKPVFYLFVIPNVIITILMLRKTRIKFGVYTSLIPILFVFLYCNWNYQRTGSYNFSSIQHINLKDYNLRYFQTYKYGSEYALMVEDTIRQAADRAETYPERIDIIGSMSMERLKKDALDYSKFHLVGIPKFFLDPGRFDMFTFFNFDPSKISEVGFLRHLSEGGVEGAIEFLKTQPPMIIVLFHGILFVNLFKFMGFIWFLVTLLRKSPFHFWIIAFFVLYVAVITGPIGAARFVVPILPLYLFMGIYGLGDLMKKIRNYWARTSLAFPSS